MTTLHEILYATAGSTQVCVKLLDRETNEEKVKVQTRRVMTGAAEDVLSRLFVMARDGDKSLKYVACIDGNTGGEIHISAEPMTKPRRYRAYYTASPGSCPIREGVSVDAAEDIEAVNLNDALNQADERKHAKVKDSYVEVRLIGINLLREGVC